jgi:L-alanine-DL-glutamate epimerase-like enolase superfamily enzyme
VNNSDPADCVIGPLALRAEVERWPLVEPFRISCYTFEVLDVLRVSLERCGQVGQGEAAGVYFQHDTPADMLKQVEPLKARIEGGISRNALYAMFPSGGARNALDCALWDLQAKLSGRPAWLGAGLNAPRPLLTTFGCGADAPEKMAAVATAYVHARAIKLKLTGARIDKDRVRAVREARPDVWLAVDANQGFTRSFLEELLPVLLEMKVSLIEQPFPVGQEQLLDGFQSPIPIAADESVRDRSDIPTLAHRFNVVNIKLDKCGGLTEGLAMERAARELGLKTMVGNMIGTSLAMAPAFLLGQLCQIVDLDGPLFLKTDRAVTVRYTDGFVMCPETLWGYGAQTHIL